MKNKTIPFHKDRRLKFIIILAVIVSSLIYLFGMNELAVGVLVGTPLGVFNYWMMWDAVQKGQTLENKEANKMFFGRSLIRLVLSIIALILALQVGVYFLLGVMIGLFLHLSTYSIDVLNILRGKKLQ
ncbi:MAG: hypothetical protein APF76_17590 [Desulfitibacter sp. BRH_c19]|nr:MAG: hypothetical protein APF76_17590 [Desulfitibacter sp. BRH_c19]